MAGLAFGEAGPHTRPLFVVHLHQYLAGTVQRSEHVGAVVRHEAFDDARTRSEPVTDGLQQIAHTGTGRGRHADRVGMRGVQSATTSASTRSDLFHASSTGT